MSIKIYNTLVREKINFIPLKEKTVSMYLCGPTVYSDCHIGHIMGPVLFDTIARWFRLRDYKTNFVNNITDIDDKIINKSIETNEHWKIITKRYTEQYFKLLIRLKVETINHFPKCTDYISQMIEYIKVLIDKGFAYSTNNGIYFSVKKQKNYGKLSGQKLKNLQTSYTESNNIFKKNQADFCLWKITKKNEPNWESPWGTGRPGWHLECSVMSNSLLGKNFDIHGGGDDLKFPHHENEIAQGEAFCGSYAQCWMHNGLVEYEGEKIGKSDPRMQDKKFSQQFKAKFLIDTYGSDTIRFFILRGHYRRPFDFAPKELNSTKKALLKIKKEFIENNIKSNVTNLKQVFILAKLCHQQSIFNKFCQAMDNDFNTGLALTQVFSLINLSKKYNENKSKILTFANALLSLLGIELELSPSSNKNTNLSNDLIKILINLRESARIKKNWNLADDIRKQLEELNISLEDGKNGCHWEKKND